MLELGSKCVTLLWLCYDPTASAHPARAELVLGSPSGPMVPSLSNPEQSTGDLREGY